MRQVLMIAAVLSVLGLVGANTGHAHGQFTNTTGRPLRILDLNDIHGKPFARLVMTGEKMTINHYNYPESGAGYYEALPGHDYFIPFTSSGVLGGLHVDKVAWDDAGKTIAIEGLRPFFDGAEKIRITSDVRAPKIQDGILYLKLAGHGNQEYGFKIVFGLGVSITPPLNQAP
ncbi:MAG: hypothetical protein JRI36_00940 [Deltaproteobacteria bacterium]|nr:hypothetical protein [Deltaproteobacteria bacterium]